MKSFLRLFGLFVMVALVMSACCVAQAVVPDPAPVGTPAPTAMFVGESDAMGLYYNNAWTVGAMAAQDLDLIDFGKTRTQHLFLEGKQLIGT